MENVTISMDEKLVRLTRAKAVDAGKSRSDFISDLVAAEIEAASPPVPEGDEPNPQLEAIERILRGPKWDVTENGRMPTAEERNARR